MPYNSIIDRDDASPLIPEEAATAILTDVTRNSLALNMFRQTPMSRGQQRIPVTSALATAYFVNGDTGLKQTTSMAWDNLYLNAEEVAAIVPIPEAVLEDSAFDIWGEYRKDIAEAVGSLLDAAIFFGTNKPSSWSDDLVTGCTNAGNYITRAAQSSTNDVALEISNAMALVEADGYTCNGHAARVNMRGELRGLRDQNRQLLYLNSLNDGSTSPSLYGLPINYMVNGGWVTSGSNLPHMISGDFQQGIIGVRKDLEWKVLTEAVITDTEGNILYNLAQQDMVALRVRARFAWAIANPVNRLNSNDSTRFPFALLRAA
jgi:HK97 family phage major capsid protein